jgi:MFS family permease
MTSPDGIVEPDVPAPKDPYLALRSPAYRLFSIGSLLSAFGGQVAATALSWEIYERTHNPAALGNMGLIQVIPALLLTLPAGDMADRWDRKKILLVLSPIIALLTLSLSFLSWNNAPILFFYLVIGLQAVAQSLISPARQAILPQLVPPTALTNAWNSSRFQIALTLGPALGGFLLAFFKIAWPVYLVSGVTAIFFWGCLAFVKPYPLPPRESSQEREAPLARLTAGVHFVRHTPLILATITLDMLAVLLGGATALLPVFARDILLVGPRELGWLRAAPAVGALAMGLLLTRFPLRRAGYSLLGAVAGFGLATIVFAYSTSLWLSLVVLVLTGMLDNISVVVRHTLVQALTPAHMQGRVSAVHSVFIRLSNELGAAESGYAALWLGTVKAVAWGGVGTVLVTLWAGYKWREVRELTHLEAIQTKNNEKTRKNNSKDREK